MSPYKTVLSRAFCILGLVLAWMASDIAEAETVTLSRSAESSFLIPGFDTSLGTLTSVELTLSIEPGTVDYSGNHNHNAPLPHNTGDTTDGGLHTHILQFANIQGSGLGFPDFGILMQEAGMHHHWIGSAISATASAGSHTHQYAMDEYSYEYTGASDLAVFEAGADFSLGAAVSTTTNGLHEHQINGVPVDSDGQHYHPVPPWTSGTSAIFTYTPAEIPEPSTGLLMALGLATLLVAAMKRRRAS